MDLDKLLADYKEAFLLYPQKRREVEFKLMDAIVAEMKAIKASSLTWDSVPPALATKRGPGRPPKIEDAA